MKYLLFLLVFLLPMPLRAQQQTYIAVLPINVSDHYMTLTWSEDQNVDGFNIYRSVYFGGPYNQINTSLVKGTTYNDINVQLGYTYFYVVDAVLNGSQSTYSNVASGTVPSQ